MMSESLHTGHGHGTVDLGQHSEQKVASEREPEKKSAERGALSMTDWGCKNLDHVK